MMQRRIVFLRCVLLAFAVLVVPRAHAAVMPVTFAAADGSLSASARFEMVLGNLQVTLTNTSSADVLVPADVLTAVFFDLDPKASLTRISAVVPSGSTVLFGSTDPGGVVGGEWAYNSGLSGPGNAGLGVSSSGLGLFGPGDLFPGNNLQGPASPDGLQYGITSAGDEPATGNKPVTGDSALIKNSVVFTLGVPSGFDLDTDIQNVQFQYGTSLGDTRLPSHNGIAPEPGAMVIWSLLGALAITVGCWRRTSR
jgi:hypothetical protein